MRCVFNDYGLIGCSRKHLALWFMLLPLGVGGKSEHLAMQCVATSAKIQSNMVLSSRPLGTCHVASWLALCSFWRRGRPCCRLSPCAPARSRQWALYFDSLLSPAPLPVLAQAPRYMACPRRIV